MATIYTLHFPSFGWMNDLLPATSDERGFSQKNAIGRGPAMSSPKSTTGRELSVSLPEPHSFGDAQNGPSSPPNCPPHLFPRAVTA